MVAKLPGLLAAAMLLLPAGAAAGSFDHSYASYDALLRTHVDEAGLVTYDALRKDGRLPTFLASLAEVTPEQLADWSRGQQIAFLINAYNALTLQTIVEAPGVSSIREIKPDAWDNARWPVAGRKVSLNYLEHTRLRGQLREVRVHFVLVCAARGCPKLPRRALRPEGISEQLAGYMRAFVRDATRNRIDRTGRKLYLSKIFHWYADDFANAGSDGIPPALAAMAGKEGALVRTLYPLLSQADRSFLEDGKFEVLYSDYDWSLNSR
jgi:hypothetical protein